MRSDLESIGTAIVIATLLLTVIVYVTGSIVLGLIIFTISFLIMLFGSERKSS